MWLSNNQNTILQPCSSRRKKKEKKRLRRRTDVAQKKNQEKIFKWQQKTFAIFLLHSRLSKASNESIKYIFLELVLKTEGRRHECWVGEGGYSNLIPPHCPKSSRQISRPISFCLNKYLTFNFNLPCSPLVMWCDKLHLFIRSHKKQHKKLRWSLKKSKKKIKK